MIQRLIVVALAVAVCHADLIAVNFNCDSMLPLDKTESDGRDDGKFRINTDPMVNFQPGDVVSVSFETRGDAFNSFIIQARKPGGSEPLGAWNADDSPFYRTFSCGSSEASRPPNTIMVAAREEGRAPPVFDRIELKWIAPIGIGQIEFVATFVEENDDASVRSFWAGVTSPILSETHPDL